MSKRIAGIVSVKANGEIQSAKGEFTYNLGYNKRTAVAGADKVHGYKEEVQVAFIEGKITDRLDMNMKSLVTLEDATVTLDLANGKTIVLREGWYAGEGTGNTDEAEIDFRFESAEKGEEVRG